MSYYEIACQVCGFMNDIAEPNCGKCGNTIMEPPNVRRAILPDEERVLIERYRDANDFCSHQGAVNEKQKLEQVIKKEGRAVINIDPKFLWPWLMTGGTDYKSYQRQIYEGDRPKARWANDVKRCIVDAFLFGSEIDVVYSALSVDETGLTSYGKVSIVISEDSAEPRTSCLEENSFKFIQRLLKAGFDLDDPLPPGSFAPWHKKHELAIAKLSPKILSGMSISDLKKLVLFTEGDRQTDEFIELYIYGQIIAASIEKIKVPLTLISGLGPKELAQLEELGKHFNVEHY